MSIEGVFFDLGGTLFSYRNLARTNIPIMLESAKRLGSSASADEIKKAYARATQYVSHRYADEPYYRHHDLFHDLFKQFCEILQVDYDPKVHQWYHATHLAAVIDIIHMPIVLALILVGATWFSGVIDCLEIKPDCIQTLAYLKERGLYLSIVSNIDDDMLEPLVAREGLHHYFDHWTSSEAARSCKPHRTIFDVTLSKSELQAEQVLFVGDSPDHDIIGANAVGMRTALIIEKGIAPPLQSGRDAVVPDHTIHSLSELQAIV